MWTKIKRLLARFLPVSAGKFYQTMQDIADNNTREINEIKGVIKVLQKTIDRLVDTNRKINETNGRIYDINRRINDTNRRIYATTEQISGTTEQIRETTEQISETTKQINGTTEKISGTAEKINSATEKINSATGKINSATERVSGTANEVLWAEIFNSTSSHECDWFNDKTLSPGRWAAGYQFLYVLYRILNEIKPCNILELGLGQSTRMITQYAKNQPDAVHQVVEHDEEWISHFALGFSLGEQTQVVKLPLETESFLDDSVPVYGGFSDAFTEQKFDLISIDGPYGFLSEVYSRIDVLKLLPGCLADSFIIMVDDYNRQNAKNTVELMKQKLDEHDISYKTGLYQGIKSMCVIASENLGFVCSM